MRSSNANAGHSPRFFYLFCRRILALCFRIKSASSCQDRARLT
jgi:hypothetical protein